MKINSIIKTSSLTEDEIINVKGGINLQNSDMAASCSGCNCWFFNENKREVPPPDKPSKPQNPEHDIK